MYTWQKPHKEVSQWLNVYLFPGWGNQPGQEIAGLTVLCFTKKKNVSLGFIGYQLNARLFLLTNQNIREWDNVKAKIPIKVVMKKWPQTVQTAKQTADHQADVYLANMSRETC